MTSHRTISLILGLLALLMTVAPSSAFASTLLSGYGGPGQGSQAILGSALLNGPRGGGGPGGGSTATSDRGGQAGSPGSASTGEGSAGVRRGATPIRPTALGHGGQAANGATDASSSGGAASAYFAVERDGAARPDSGTLGLSGEDLLYILLVLAALAFMGVLTKRLTRITSHEGM
jgi:hypothetical protein